MWALISDPVKNSLILALITALFMIPLSLGLGAIAAVYAGRPADHAISIMSLAAIALPEFVIGSLLVGVFFVWSGRAAAGRDHPARRRARSAIPPS